MIKYKVAEAIIKLCDESDRRMLSVVAGKITLDRAIDNIDDDLATVMVSMIDFQRYGALPSPDEMSILTERQKNVYAKILTTFERWQTISNE